MKIAKLREIIIIQKNVVQVDAIGNHKNIWKNYYTCHTYPSTYADRESNGEVIRQNQTIVFSVRYTKKLSQISSVGFRILFQDQIYNIQSIDRMNYDHQELRIRAELEKNNE